MKFGLTMRFRNGNPIGKDANEESAGKTLPAGMSGPAPSGCTI